jgi:hypothetical protein
VRAYVGPGELARRRNWLLVASALSFVGALACLLAGVHSSFLVCTALLLTSLRLWRSWPARASGEIRVDDQSLSLGERTQVERAHVRAAFVLPSGSKVRILRGWRSPLEIMVPSPAAADELLDCLGFRLGGSVVSFRAVLGTWRRTVVPLVAVAVGGATVALARILAQPPAAPFAAVCIAAAVPFLLSLAWLLARVMAGGDGILVRRLVGATRFLSYRDVAAVRATEGGLAVILRSGRRFALQLGDRREERETRDALVKRIQDVIARFHEESTEEAIQALVAPGSRSPSQWIGALRSVTRAQDYRAAHVDEERLWRLLDDARAATATRAGAAAALLLASGAPDRNRLRVASDACADPRLRVALRRVAEATSDQEVDEALADVSARGDVGSR